MRVKPHTVLFSFVGNRDPYSNEDDETFGPLLSLLEVRSFSDYYTSEPYKLVKTYSNVLYDIVKEGQESGEIRQDLSTEFLRQVILGAIEHLCMTGVAFNRPMDPDDMTEKICSYVFRGLEPR